MNDKILKLLRYGERKEIGRSADAARLLVKNKSAIDDFFSLMLDLKDDDVVVSHASYALKEASQQSEEIAQRSVRFFFKNIKLFDQWEAKENFLRILLIDPTKTKLSKKQLVLIEEFLKSKSAIVSAYTLEVLVTFKYLNEDQTFIDHINFGLSHEKAAVSARARKLAKKYKT